jgi:hypothetical protein
MTAQDIRRMLELLAAIESHLANIELLLSHASFGQAEARLAALKRYRQALAEAEDKDQP